MAAKEIGIIEKSGVTDRKVEWDKTTGQVWVQYYKGGFFSSWERRTSKMKANTINQAYEIARAILDE